MRIGQIIEECVVVTFSIAIVAATLYGFIYTVGAKAKVEKGIQTIVLSKDRLF